MDFPATIEDFYSNLAVPESCYLGKRLFKKHFYENGQLNVSDKKAFKEDIESIEWMYTLKPSTINIPSFEDDTHEYLEVALVQVTLSSDKRHTRIAEVIQKAIPYPVVIVFLCGSDIALNVGVKRINRADSNKMVVESYHDTGWIPFGTSQSWQQEFLNDFQVKSLSYQHFFQFYQDIADRITAYNCAVHTGAYSLVAPEQKDGMDRGEALKELERLERELTELRNKLKKEKNLGNQVQLNTRAHSLSQKIDQIKRTL
nr:DUF4391 domain-containing protein [uncultured Pseudodesulfovibrio sp.]